MKTRISHNSMETLFAFGLLGMFAVACLFLTVLGVRVYRGSAAAYTGHNTDRILSSYIRSMVRAADREGVISVEDEGGVQSLALREEYDGVAYVTRLYCSDGKLREWFSEENHAFRPEDGTPVCDAAKMQVELRDGLVLADIQKEETSDPVQIAVRVFCE